MLGFQERQYIVLDTHQESIHAEFSYTLEKRETVQTKQQYIALKIVNRNKIIADELLMYKSTELLEQDWLVLTSPDLIQLNNLAWDEKISNHHIGRTKNGSVRMY